ncbi:MAG: hypothetical protein ACRCZ2_06620 [Fusobacteriaceae bacterium]
MEEIEKIIEFLEKRGSFTSDYDGLIFYFLETEYCVDKDGKFYVLKKLIGTVGIGKLFFPITQTENYNELLEKTKMYLEGELENGKKTQ